MKKLFILLLSTPFYLLGQSDAGGNFNSKFPSTNAISSVQGENYQNVDYNTGAATANIPLYNVSRGGVGLNISLNYFSTGIKSTDAGSWIGMGWSLQAGGAITRVVNGNPDDLNTAQNVGYFYTRSNNLSNVNAPNNVINSFFENDAINDISPDIFRFNFLGRTGKLVFTGDPTGNDPYYGEITTVPYQDLIVEVTAIDAGNSSISEFTIIDEKGIQYVFGSPQGSDYSEIIKKGNVMGLEDAYTQAWHLNKIKLPNNEIIFSFFYKNVYDGGRTYTPGYGWGTGANIVWDLPSVIVPSYTVNNIGSPSTNGIAPCPIGTTPISQERKVRRFQQNQIYLERIQFEGGDYVFQSENREVGNPPHATGVTPQQMLRQIDYYGPNEYQNQLYPISSYVLRGHRDLEALNSHNVRRGLYDLTLYGHYDVNFISQNPRSNEPEFDNRPVKGTYLFGYYSHLSFVNSREPFPEVLSVDVDAWGYANGAFDNIATDKTNYSNELFPTFNYIDRNGVIQTYDLPGKTYPNSTRQPSTDVNIVQSGALSGIIFPNQSSIVYTYELNEAYEKDFFDHINLTTSSKANRICGGIRVKSITKFNKDQSGANDLVSEKWYNYETVDINGNLTGQSSGIVFNKSPLMNRYEKTARAGTQGGLIPNDLCFTCKTEVIIPSLVDNLALSYNNHMTYSTVTEIIKSKLGDEYAKNIYYFDVYQQYPIFYQEPIEYLDQASLIARSTPFY